MHRTTNDDRSLPGSQRDRMNKGTLESDSVIESEVQASDPARASSIDAKIDQMMSLLLDNEREVASIHVKLEPLQADMSNVHLWLEQGRSGGQKTEESRPRQTSSRQPEEEERPAQPSRQKSGQRRRSEQNSHRAMEDAKLSILKIRVRSAECVPQMDRMFSADPYLKLELDGQEFTTKPKKKTLNPTWNERWEGVLV